MEFPSIYQRLGEHQIRLIEILPSAKSQRRDGTIRCVISVASLENMTLRYNALSYTWRRDNEYEVHERSFQDGVSSCIVEPDPFVRPAKGNFIIIRRKGSHEERRSRVQHNLLCALERFREEAYECSDALPAPTNSLVHNARYRWGNLLWTDALCINQEDILERNH
jgi:hypothetical protein